MLECHARVKLNLTTTAYGGEYSSDVVGEVTRCIFENGVSVPSQAERILRVTRYAKIWMIEDIVGFHSERNTHTFAQSEALIERRIKFRERGTAQAIPSSSAEVIGRWHRKRARIEPAPRSTHPAPVWTNTRVRIAYQIWSIRYEYRLHVCVVEGQHWSERDVAVNASNR